MAEKEDLLARIISNAKWVFIGIMVLLIGVIAFYYFGPGKEVVKYATANPLVIMLLAILFLFGVLFYLYRGRKFFGEKWYDAWDCFEWALNRGGLRYLGKINDKGAWEAVIFTSIDKTHILPAKIEANKTWLFIGKIPGTDIYAVEISGTDKNGDCILPFFDPITDKDVRRLITKETSLQEAIQTLQAVKGAVEEEKKIREA